MKKEDILESKGYDVSEEGAQMYNMPTGVYVKEVMSGGGAEKAGLTKRIDHYWF